MRLDRRSSRRAPRRVAQQGDLPDDHTGDTSATVRTPSAPVWVTSAGPDRMARKDTAARPGASAPVPAPPSAGAAGACERHQRLSGAAGEEIQCRKFDGP